MIEICILEGLLWPQQGIAACQREEAPNLRKRDFLEV